MEGPAQLPPKPDVALLLLQSQSSVYVHLDPRGPDVFVPAWFKNQPQLVLQVGMNMAVPIPDLNVGQTALSCTLSFNRRPEFCKIPWDAVYGLVGEDGRGMIWPDSIPPEVASAAKAAEAKSKESKRPKGHLRLAHSEPPGPVSERETERPSLSEQKEQKGAADDELPPSLAAEPSPEPADRPEAQSERDGADENTSGSSEPPRPSAKKLPSYLRVIK
ncbi:MAG: hypothetical protein B6A08_12695 [Sorangiineae bacterium NIC37A_2]|jgi:hypothetical protein|nr:MAG: hypothetical protein B6A08_12695 [Sorangiineae bacterium NIC37A_2]